MHPATRRQFLGTTAVGGVLAGLGDLGFLSRLPCVGAAEARLAPNVVQLQPDIEPLVRLIEDSPREKLLERVAERIHGGTSYREVLAALLLAGVRNVKPRPEVGFKFHAVLVVNSAHLASLASPDEHRWLPIFWALDHFKDAQADQRSKEAWQMPPVDEASLPASHQAKQAFIEAMDNWDEAKADAAVAALARSAGMDEIYELFFRYGARDYRAIGHKAIFVANSRRTLSTIGWQYAEPVLRSLAFALLKHENENPSRADLAPDRSWRENLPRAEKLRDDWTTGKAEPSATHELLGVLRTGSADEASALAAELLNRGVAPQSVWDAVFLGAGELLMRQPGIVALHAVTTTNALRYAFDTTADDYTRRMLLLQNVAFLPQFRAGMQGRGKLGAVDIEALSPAKLDGDATEAAGEILADISRNRDTAARKVLAYVEQHPQPKELIDAARVAIFFKGTNAHDYKFSSAVLEDYLHLSPEYRGRYLASSVYNLRGSGDRDNSLVKRTRAALGS